MDKKLEDIKRRHEADALFYDDIEWLIETIEKQNSEIKTLKVDFESLGNVADGFIEEAEKGQRYKNALEKIVTRSMSMYLTKDDLTKDLYEIAWQGLEGDKVK